MKTHSPRHCIVPPHVLKHMLKSEDAEIREIALKTLLATTTLRAERNVVAGLGFLPNATGRKRRSIYDCATGTRLEDARLVRSESDAAVADSSVNAAYDGLGATYDFYSEVLARNSIDDRGMRLDGYVHFGRSYNNAFWDGRHMVFGDGDGRVFTDFTRSLDVIAHELTHGMTEFVAGLEYHNQSGALNESVSDVFGSLVKQWILGQTADQADWLIGAEVFTPSVKGDALRSLKSPGLAYDDPIIGRDPQPGHMNDYIQLPDTEEEDWGGVHIYSGIPNRAFYLAATGIGGQAWHAAGHIWFSALKASGPMTDFRQFAINTVQSAGVLYGTGSAQQQIIISAWREVGVRDVAPTTFGTTTLLTQRERDSQIELIERIEALTEEVRTISQQLGDYRQKSA